MQYFKSRSDAGLQLAKKLEKYRFENTAVVALSDGGVIVGAQIAKTLHCVMTMLLLEGIYLPGEKDPIAAVNQSGGFTFNNMFSAGQLEGFRMEYHNHIEQEKLRKVHKLNRLLSDGGLTRPELLKGHNVILVSDGLEDGLYLDVAADFLKPITIEKLIVATPLASVKAVDRMHLLADEIVCLNVLDHFMPLDHYFDDNFMPPHDEIVRTIESIVLHWQ